MKVIIAAYLGGSILIATLGATLIACERYTSPYRSCVRAQMADPKNPESEADAHLTCARWIKTN